MEAYELNRMIHIWGFERGTYDMDRIRVSIVSYTENGERLVASASKVTLSRKPFQKIIEMSDEEVEKWIMETWRRQHFSPWEHSSYTWVVEGCSRICSHQLVRHRIASYTQQSMRYTEGALREIALRASKMVGMDCPESPKRAPPRGTYSCYSDALKKAVDLLDGDSLVDLARLAYVIPPTLRDNSASIVSRQYIEATAAYYELLANGVPREDARFVIPNAVRTRLTVTMNARELVQSFLPLRMCTKAQWEIRWIAWQLWKELVKIHPRLFKWAGPRCVYLENVVRDMPASLDELLEDSSELVIPRCPELVPREGIKNCIRHAMSSLKRI